MKEYIDPFLYNLPHLDLHGYDRTGAEAKVKMFIDENIRIDNKKVINTKIFEANEENLESKDLRDIIKHCRIYFLG